MYLLELLVQCYSKRMLVRLALHQYPFVIAIVWLGSVMEENLKMAKLSRLENGKADVQLTTLFRIFEGLGRRVSLTIL